MRILQVINVGADVGGAEASVRLIGEGLTARGHDVRTVATDLLAAGRPTFAHDLVPAIAGPALLRFLRKLWYPRAYRQVRAVVRDFRPECVHLHTIGEFSASVLDATAGRPRLLTVHGPEDWTRDLLRWQLPSAPGPGGLTAADRLRYAYLRFVQRPGYLTRLRHVDRILTPSRYFADAVVADVGRDRTHVVPNGVPPGAAPTPVPAGGTGRCGRAGRGGARAARPARAPGPAGRRVGRPRRPLRRGRVPRRPGPSLSRGVCRP